MYDMHEPIELKVAPVAVAVKPPLTVASATTAPATAVATAATTTAGLPGTTGLPAVQARTRAVAVLDVLSGVHTEVVIIGIPAMSMA
mmetsp:Transcript_21410/g.56624  ORF Transcript_21410/g.56624 Transcript_21410/m.56624 type:complete len:87 (-) Transcript_21410:14-274(-)